MDGGIPRAFQFVSRWCEILSTRQKSAGFMPLASARRNASSMTRSMWRNVAEQSVQLLHGPLTSIGNIVCNSYMAHGLEKAISAAGGLTRLAELIGQSPQTVSNWRNRSGGFPPVEHCPDIEKVTRDLGSPVLCEELRPEVNWAVLRTPARAAA